MTRDDLTDALRDLPDEVPVPEHLDARVLALATTRRRGPGWVGLALSATGGALATAAVAALLLAGTPAPGEYRLIEGIETVRGDGVMLLAGGVWVQIDGEAHITVEPRDGTARRDSPEVNMGASHWLAAAGGAAVTVVVITGAAMVWPEGGMGPLELRAGESWTSEEAGGPVGGPTPLAIRLSPDSAAGAAALSGDLEGATQAALAAEVQRLRTEAALMRGQLERYQGTPEPWPDQVPADLEPTNFEATIEDVLKDMPDVELVRLDCDEYPCLAVVRAKPGTPDSPMVLKGVAESMAVKGGGDGEEERDRGVMMAIGERQGDDGESVAVGVVGVLDGSLPPDPDREARMHQRLTELEQEEQALEQEE